MDPVSPATGWGPRLLPGENADDEWRVESDGTGDLLVFCPGHWRREFRYPG